MGLPKDKIKQESKNNKKGLDDWNNRLDENMESNEQNDVVADDLAKKFSEKNSNRNQSDAAEKS